MKRLPRLLRLILLSTLLLATGVTASAQEMSQLTDDELSSGISVRLGDGDSPVIATSVERVDYHAQDDDYNIPVGDASLCCDEYWGWTILPEGIIYRNYLASVTESRLGLVISHVADNDDAPGEMFDGTLGGRKGLLRYGNRDPYNPQGFQVDVEAAAMVRLNFEEDMDVQATDYRVGVPFTYGWGNRQIKFGYWHLSSHLGDEFMIRNVGAFTRYNYAKDSLVFGYSEYLSENMRVYGEASWAFWSDVAEEWEFQFGLEHAPRCPTGIYGAPFFAANGHLYEENNFGGHFVVQTGWAWRADQGGGLLRIGLHYLNGTANQRSFWNQHEQQIGIGIWYDN